MMSPDSDDLQLPGRVRGSPPRMQVSGEQYVHWWISNLEKLAANGQLERMLIERGKRRQAGVPFTWRD